MILTLPPAHHEPPAVRSCIDKVREVEWVKVGHNKWVRVIVVKNEPGTWEHGRCVPDPVRRPAPKPTHIPTGKPTSKPTGKPTGKPTVKPTGKPTLHPAV